MKRKLLAVFVAVMTYFVLAGPRENVVLTCFLMVVGLGWAVVDGLLEVIEVWIEESDSSDEDLIVEYHDPYGIDTD